MNSLHGQIMNLSCDSVLFDDYHNSGVAYRVGHRDARHAAAELAIAVEKQRDELLAALKEYVATSHEVDVGGGDFVVATCESRESAIAAIAKAEAKP